MIIGRKGRLCRGWNGVPFKSPQVERSDGMATLAVAMGGLLNRPAQARRAVDELRRAGYSEDEIGYLTRASATDTGIGVIRQVQPPLPSKSMARNLQPTANCR